MPVSIPPPAVPLVRLGDAKLVQGLQLGQWVDRGPTMEECIALSSISQDELGHARALYDLAKEAGAPGAHRLQYERPSHAFRPPAALLLPRAAWSDVVLSIAVLDRVLLHECLADARTGGLSAKLRQEEAWHLHHGDAWLVHLASVPAGKRELHSALERTWPAIAHWLHELAPAPRAAAADDIAAVLQRAGLHAALGRKDGVPAIELAAGPELDAAVEAAVADVRVELVAMLQDPAGRAIAEAFDAGG